LKSKKREEKKAILRSGGKREINGETVTKKGGLRGRFEKKGMKGLTTCRAPGPPEPYDENRKRVSRGKRKKIAGGEKRKKSLPRGGPLPERLCLEKIKGGPTPAELTPSVRPKKKKG